MGLPSGPLRRAIFLNKREALPIAQVALLS